MCKLFLFLLDQMKASHPFKVHSLAFKIAKTQGGCTVYINVMMHFSCLMFYADSNGISLPADKKITIQQKKRKIRKKIPHTGDKAPLDRCG